jgi:Holliday junction resolvase RusA-like endonuclease
MDELGKQFAGASEDFKRLNPGLLGAMATPAKPRAKRYTGKHSQRKQKACADATLPLRLGTIISANIAPVGKPRMTQRDKWKQRPCVMAYRAFCDVLRAEAGDRVPPASRVEHMVLMFFFATPDESLWGEPYRKKPDGDNCVKSVLDALWKDDEKLGRASYERAWAKVDGVSIVIHTTPPHQDM